MWQLGVQTDGPHVLAAVPWQFMSIPEAHWAKQTLKPPKTKAYLFRILAMRVRERS
jgi:hypothetical protein